MSVEDLRREVVFLRKQWDNCQREKTELREDNKKLRLILLRQPIPIEAEKYDPKRFRSITELIKNSAPLLTQERVRRGFYDWKWEDVQKYMERRSRRKFNAETVARVCRKLAEEGELVKTDEGRYTWRSEEG